VKINKEKERKKEEKMKKIIAFIVAELLMAQPVLAMPPDFWFGGNDSAQIQEVSDHINEAPTVHFSKVGPYEAEVGQLFGLLFAVVDRDGDLTTTTVTGGASVIPFLGNPYYTQQFRYMPTANDAGKTLYFTLDVDDTKVVVRTTQVVLVVAALPEEEDVITISGVSPSYNPSVNEGEIQEFTATGTSSKGNTVVVTYYLINDQNDIVASYTGDELVYMPNYRHGGDDGTYRMYTVRAEFSTTETNATHEWAGTVVDVNSPPCVVFGNIGTFPVNQPGTIPVSVVDREEDPFTVTVAGLAGANYSDGVIYFTPTVVGDAQCTVTATDNRGASNSASTTVTVTAGDTGDTTPPVLDAYYIGVENNNGITADVVVTVPVGAIFNPRVVGDLIDIDPLDEHYVWSYLSGIGPNTVIGNMARFNNVPVDKLQDFGIYVNTTLVFSYSEVKVDWAVYLVSTDGHTYHLRLK